MTMILRSVHNQPEYHGCETAFVCVQNDVLQAVDKNRFVAFVLLDLLPAFDSVNHSIFCGDFSSRFGFGGKVLAWFKSYLEIASNLFRLTTLFLRL